MKNTHTLRLASQKDVRTLLGIDDIIIESEMDRLFESISGPDRDASAEPGVLEVLFGLVRKLQARTIVEIGTFRGISSYIMASALSHLPNSRIYTIDNGCEKDMNAASDRLQDFIKCKSVIQIRQSSIQAFKNWGRATIDLLFIDGSHEFADACADFALWVRYVRPGGIIVMHDTFTRLDRRFPEDYIFPLSYYSIMNIAGVEEWYRGHEWEGLAVIQFADSQRIV
jgi:predicted O-methyltransferase YrrM